MSIDYSGLPYHMREGFKNYMERHFPMGDFGMFVLRNDLMAALGHADDINRERIFDICRWLYNEAPPGSYGSAEKVAAWLASGPIIQEEA